MGETGIWYAFFLPVTGILVEKKWNIRWIRVYCLLTAMLFIVIELISPDSYDKTLMPALQSPWFVPHVIVYIVSYAFLGASSIMGFYGLYLGIRGRESGTVLNSANLLVVLGFVFLTLGLLFWRIRAKEAWGNYLDLGPERNLGVFDVDHLFNLSPLHTKKDFRKQNRFYNSCPWFCGSSVLLVRY